MCSVGDRRLGRVTSKRAVGVKRRPQPPVCGPLYEFLRPPSGVARESRMRASRWIVVFDEVIQFRAIIKSSATRRTSILAPPRAAEITADCELQTLRDIVRSAASKLNLTHDDYCVFAAATLINRREKREKLYALNSCTHYTFKFKDTYP